MLKPVKAKPPKHHKALFIDNQFWVTINKILYPIDTSKYKVPDKVTIYANNDNDKYSIWAEKTIDKKHLNQIVLKYWSLLKPNIKIKGAVLNNKYYLTWKES